MRMDRRKGAIFLDVREHLGISKEKAVEAANGGFSCWIIICWFGEGMEMVGTIEMVR